MTTPNPEPGPPPSPLLPSPTPGCSHTGCPATPLAQWQRRPNQAELDAAVAAAQSRRDEILAAADPQQPAPVLPPLPTEQDTTIAVFGCADHAIDMGLAAHVHAADCRAPHEDHLPGCGCEPEPLPDPEPLDEEMVTLRTGWTVPARSIA